MWVGLGIFLLVVSVVLEWAVKVDIPGVGQHTLGWILMGGGVLAIIWSFIAQAQRQRLHNNHDEQIVHQTNRTPRA